VTTVCFKVGGSPFFMIMVDTFDLIIEYCEKRDWQAYQDAISYLNGHFDMDKVLRLRNLLTRQLIEKPNADAEYAYRMSLLVAATKDFDSYMQYMEADRKPEERFWLPRRKVLMPVCQGMQDLADDKLDELFLSCPPRVGKSTLAIFFTTWVMGRETEYPKLYSSYSDIITKAFYNGVMEILTDFDTYKFKEVFPQATISRTNAQDETIDLERKKHYPTLTCRSLYGTLNGACDAEKGIIISDDLIGGIEEALNKDRLTSAWAKVDNNLIPRGKGGTKYLWIGTRWSMIDPAGIRMELLENDEKFKGHRWKVINTPALNDKDESNFVYDYGVGFDTVYYQRRRASFERNNDMASWLAQYMGEPIEREGTVFSPQDFRYYNGTLPDGEADRIFMAVDPAWGGGDFVASPICYQYGDDIFVADVVYSNEDKGITQPLIASKIEKHNVSFAYIEGTKMTASYGEGVDALLKKKDLHVNIQTSTKHFTGMGKEQRIFDKAPDIREHFIFLASGNRSKEYELFMQNVFAFKIMGKNKNDDAPDSLAMATTVAFYPTTNRATVLKRVF